jgi:transposase
MEMIVETVFPNATKVTDRFHVMKNIQDDVTALKIRIKTLIKKQYLEEEQHAKKNKEKYRPERYMN